MKPIYKFTIAGIILVASYIGYRKFNKFISKRGIKFLTDLEGKRNKMYLDSKGLPTIGVGHLIKPEESNLLSKTLTDLEVQKLFDKDLDRFEKAVKDSITVPLKQHQKDALVSLAFNIGENGFKRSTLVKAINNKASDSEIIENFLKWRTPSVLIKRREKESKLYTTGNYN